MALSVKLSMRQGQSLVMTPQLLQAIKLLQLSNIELAGFIEEELERNPLLERVEEAPQDRLPEPDVDADPRSGDWSTQEFETDAAALEARLGTEVGNTFDADRAATPTEPRETIDGSNLSATSWTGTSGGGDGEPADMEAYVAARPTLHEHLAQQLALATGDPIERMIGTSLIDLVDEAGYLSAPLSEVAGKLGAPLARVEATLRLIHTFDPTGVGARDLAECLALQLRERDRFDPAMQALVANLGLVARRDFAGLRRVCQVDDEDVADMLAEIRRLDPKPGRAFGGAPLQPVVPDVFVRASATGDWTIELNSEVLPRVLVNQSYQARIARGKARDEDRVFVANCLQTANWLTKSLEQRARTILKVATEIVRQQDAFFAAGVEHLRPLNLKTVADAIGMHESTVSRVTSNKYVSSPRGLFELKYFFTASIASSKGGDMHSAEAVRYKIRTLIDQESPQDVLSDDAIVARLRTANVDIARRTVAKYRESLRIPSSVERRREKQSLGLHPA